MPRRWILSLAAVVAVVAVALVPATPAAATPAAVPGPGVGHVFVVNLENKDYRATWGRGSPATYLNATLRPQGVVLTRYFGTAHHSLPDYIAQISGQGPSGQTQADCPEFTEFVRTGTGAFEQALGDGCVYPSSVITIADQLDAAGLAWKAYQEDIESSATAATTCRHPKLGGTDRTLTARRGDQYATRHNPFMYFHSVIDSPTCGDKVVGLDALARDLTTVETTPAYSYITPNLCNDGHDDPCVDGRPGGLVAADAWLREWMPRILQSPAFRQDGMLVITFDEAEDDAAHLLRLTGTAQRRACGHRRPGWWPRRRAGAVAVRDPGNDEPRSVQPLLAVVQRRRRVRPRASRLRRPPGVGVLRRRRVHASTGTVTQRQYAPDRVNMPGCQRRGVMTTARG